MWAIGCFVTAGALQMYQRCVRGPNLRQRQGSWFAAKYQGGWLVVHLSWWRHEKERVGAVFMVFAKAEGPSHGDVEWDVRWESEHWNWYVDRHRHWHLKKYGHWHLHCEWAIHWHWHSYWHGHRSVNHHETFLHDWRRSIQIHF